MKPKFGSEKIHKIDKLLSRLIRQKTPTKTHVTNIMNERDDIMQVLQIFGA